MCARGRAQGLTGLQGSGWAPRERTPRGGIAPAPLAGRLRTAPCGSLALTTAGVAASAACPSTSGGTSPPSRLHPLTPAGLPQHASPPAKDGGQQTPAAAPAHDQVASAGTTGDRPVCLAFPWEREQGTPHCTQGSGPRHLTQVPTSYSSCAPSGSGHPQIPRGVEGGPQGPLKGLYGDSAVPTGLQQPEPPLPNPWANHVLSGDTQQLAK